jgi:glutamine cyclotransferase
MCPTPARLAIAAAVFTLAGCGAAAPPSPPAQSSAPSPTSHASAAPGAIPADSIRVSLGGETNGVTVCAGSVWVAAHTQAGDGVAQIDPVAGKVLGVIEGATNSACFEDSLWVADGTAIQHVDPATRAAIAKVPLEAFYVGAAAGSIWAPSHHDVARIDPKTAAIVATIHVSDDADVTEVEGDNHAIWATVKERNTIDRIDPATNKVVAAIEGGGFAHGILVQPDAIWISKAHQTTITRIDPATNATVTIKGVGAGVGLAEGGGYVWASTRTELFRINPATNQATMVVRIGGWPYGIGFLNDVLWVVDGTDSVYGIPIVELLPP